MPEQHVTFEADGVRLAGNVLASIREPWIDRRREPYGHLITPRFF